MAALWACGVFPQAGADPVARAGNLTALTTFNPSGVPIVGVQFNGNNGAYQAGPFTTTIWDDGTLIKTVESWCVDFTHGLVSSVMPVVLSQQTGVVTGASTGQPFDRDLGAAGWLLANIDPVNADQRAALQVAIWEVIYDYPTFVNGTTALATGLFRLTSGYNTATILPIAASYLNAAWDSDLGQYRHAPVTFIQYNTLANPNRNQDQIALAAVPEPSTMLAAVPGVALALAAWSAHRLRRRPRG